MSNSQKLEATLDQWFGKKAPMIPASWRKMLVEWAPWVSLVAGVLTLASAWTLWSWAHAANYYLDMAQSICNGYAIYGSACANTPLDHMSLWVWLGIAILGVEGALYVLAFPGLRDRKKAGWNYLYWGVLVNLVYVVVSLLTGYGVTGFVGALIGSAVGFWILFQVRGAYTAK